MSCRTGPLRVERPLRGGYTGFAAAIICWPPVGRHIYDSDQREDRCSSFFLDKLKRRANARPTRSGPVRQDIITSFPSSSATSPTPSSPSPSGPHTPSQTSPPRHRTASRSPDTPPPWSCRPIAHVPAPASLHTPPHTPSTLPPLNPPVVPTPYDRSAASPESPAHPSSSIPETGPTATASRALPPPRVVPGAASLDAPDRSRSHA